MGRQLRLWHTVLSVFFATGRNNKNYLFKLLVFVMKKHYVFYEAGTKFLDIVLWSMFFKTLTEMLGYNLGHIVSRQSVCQTTNLVPLNKSAFTKIKPVKRALSWRFVLEK